MPEEVREDRLRALEEAVRRDPASALYLPFAERLREQGRADEAVRLCEERRNRPGRGVGDRIVTGRCYLADGRLAEARAEFEAAVSLDRENVVALKALAGILAHEGDHRRAADLYRAVCRVDPGDLESQTALHQITSGEFPEVRPPDVVVDTGEVAWQPVRLPREEEHLSDLALGLRTIENFDAAAPRPGTAKVMDFQELAIEALEHAPPAARVAPAEPSAAAETLAPAEPPASAGPTASVESPAPPEPPRSAEVLMPASAHAAAAPPAPVEAPPPAAPPAPEAPAPAAPAAPEPEPAAAEAPEIPGPAEPERRGAVAGNKSAFEEWLSRLGGRR